MSIRNDPLWQKACDLTLRQAGINRRSVEALLAFYGVRRAEELATYQLPPYITELEKLLNTGPKFKVGDRVELPSPYGLGTVEHVNVVYTVRRDGRRDCINPGVWDERVIEAAPVEPTLEERIGKAFYTMPYACTNSTRGSMLIQALREAGFNVTEKK